MTTLKRSKSKRLSTGVRIPIGIATAAVITVVIALVLSSAIAADKIQDNRMYMLSKIVWLLSSAAGCMIGISREDVQKLAKGAIIAAGYLLILLIISAVVYEINIGSVIYAIIASMLGSLAVCGLKSRGNRTVSKRKWR